MLKQGVGEIPLSRFLFPICSMAKLKVSAKSKKACCFDKEKFKNYRYLNTDTHFSNSSLFKAEANVYHRGE